MKQNSIQKILLLTTCIVLMLYTNNARAQSFAPVVGTNYYYLTRGIWKITSIDQDTITRPALDSESFQYTFYVTMPYGSDNVMTTKHNDTISDFITYQFVDPTQQQIVVAYGTSAAQTWTIDYIDDNLFIYKANYTVNGTLYNFRFVMLKVS